MAAPAGKLPPFPGGKQGPKTGPKAAVGFKNRHTTFGLTVDAGLLRRLYQQRKRDGVPLSAVLTEALTAWFATPPGTPPFHYYPEKPIRGYGRAKYSAHLPLILGTALREAAKILGTTMGHIVDEAVAMKFAREGWDMGMKQIMKPVRTNITVDVAGTLWDAFVKLCGPVQRGVVGRAMDEAIEEWLTDGAPVAQPWKYQQEPRRKRVGVRILLTQERKLDGHRLSVVDVDGSPLQLRRAAESILVHYLSKRGVALS